MIFTAQSGALAMGQQFYALLQRRALTDTELATALETVKKNAPQMLQPASPATQGQAASAAPAAQAAQAASTPAVATPAATGSGAAAAATTGGHS